MRKSRSIHYMKSSFADGVHLGNQETADRNGERVKMSKQSLKDELQYLQQRTQTGFELRIKWLPGFTKYQNGKLLAEEVEGNNIVIYSDDMQECKELVRHGFIEWILNQYTKTYRQLINTLITLFEELQYEKKEKIIDTLTQLL